MMTPEEMSEELAHLNQLKKEHQRRMRVLELQKAREGSECDPRVINEIDDIKREIIALEQGIAELLSQGQSNVEPSKSEQSEDQAFSDMSTEGAEEILNTNQESFLFNEMIDAIIVRDMQRAAEVYGKLQSTEQSDDNKFRNETLYLFLSYKYGNVSSLKKLHDLSDRFKEQPEKHTQVNYFIGACYDQAGNFERALDSYEAVVRETESEEKKAETVALIARCLFNMGKQQEALSRITQEIPKLTSRESQSHLYEALASLHDQMENHELRAIALEKALDLKPNDKYLRFGAAYSYSNASLNTVSLLHYKTLLEFYPDDEMSLNNIAVQYNEFNMPIQAVKHYKKSFELNNTLAAANLAFMYLQLGFIEEAKQVLDRARQQKDVHQNVGSALASISARESAEIKAEKEVIIAAREQQRFLIRFAEAFFSETFNEPAFDAIWMAEDGAELKIEKKDAIIKSEWESGGKKYDLVGEVKNRGVRITSYQDKSNQYYHSKMADIGYAYLSSQGDEIRLMLIKDGKHSFLNLRKHRDSEVQELN